MKKQRELGLLAVIFAMMLLPLVITPATLVTHSPTSGDPDSTSGDTRLVDIGNGEFIEVGPNEQLHRFVLTEQGWMEWSGTSAPLVGGEYGNSTTTFDQSVMSYVPGSGTDTYDAQIPIGTDWEAYMAQVDITAMTENRTWFLNPGFQGSATSWTIVPENSAGYSTVKGQWFDDGHGLNDDCVEVEISSDSSSQPYYYDNNDQAWARQSVTIDRGAVVWAGFTVDYWADTQDDTHYGMTGSFQLYLNVEGQYVWRKVFEDIGAEETWYHSGLVSISPSTFSDNTITAELGLWSIAAVGYAPDIAPRARFDNFELYLKTLVDPSDINLQMNGQTVSDGPTPGVASITQVPASPWTTSPVSLTFSWTPTPSTPDPDKTILVEFDATADLYARRLDTNTVYEIVSTSYGERFTVNNGTSANFTTYFRANIPTGYSNLYFFNESLPLDRDVFFVAQPLAPSTNLTSGWTGGDPGDGFLNVSTYDITGEAGRYGYWRILSTSPNMINDLRLWTGSAWERNVELRAGDTTQIRVYVGAGFTGSVVNITVYEPDGSEWMTTSAVADGSGYATTTTFSLPGSTAPAGDWMVQAHTNNVGTGSEWTSVGFFKRGFKVVHASALTLTYPDDAVGTMVTNVTYGDLLLIITEVEDTDSSILVPGGVLTLNWVLGTDTFDDSGNGEYTKVVDTSLLPGKGAYVMTLNWSHSSFDDASAALTINVNYPATLTSPEYPGIEGPVGDAQTFTVDFSNTNGTGITGADVTCNWTNPYTITPQGSGLYQFQLDTTGMPIGEYPVEITARNSFVEPQTLVMYVQVREIYNSIKYSANELSIPLGEAESFLLTWTDTDHNTPIQGSASSITCNWTDFHQSGDVNYTVVETSPGVYNITIYTKSDDPLTGPDKITVTFNIEKFNYQNHTFDVGVEIRKRNTLFVLDEPIGQTPYGSTITVLVFYQDTDLRVGIANDTGEVRITVSTPDLSSLTFSCADSSYGAGHYNISIPSDQWGSIGWKDLTIFIEWVGAVDKFYSQTILTSVRVTGTDTDIFLEQAPSATYYQDSFSFSIVYYDMVSSIRITNSSGHVFLVITPLDAGHLVTQSDFTVYESGTTPGTYYFSLDSSLFPSTDTFRFELAFQWEKGASPLYENQTIVVSLVVLDRPTYIDYAPVPSTPYGELAEYTFSFIDTLTSSKIENSSQLLISINEPGVVFTVLYNGSTREFTLFIDTATLGGIGTHTLHLNVTYVGAPFYATVPSQSFSVTVILRSTQLSHEPFVPGQWGNNVTIEFIYTDVVAGTTSGMTGTLTLSISASMYRVTPLGNGHYSVELNTTAFASDGVYSLTATIVHSNPNYATGVETFDFSILKRSTQLGYDSPDPAPYMSNVTFTVTYTDDSTGRGIAGASVTVTGNGTSALVLDTNYWVTYLGAGQYLIEVDTTALGAPGPYLLTVSVTYSGQPYYLSASRDLLARVTERTTQILITKTPGDTPFQENIVFRFKYQDFLLGTKISITKSDITLTHGPSQTVIASGDYTLNEYSDYYEIIFNSTILNPAALVTGHEIQMTIDTGAGAPYYMSRSITTTATTVERSTQILFPLVAETPYFDNITIEFTYIDFLTGSGIDDADVVISSTNWTIPDYTLTRLGGGLYRVSINTTVFGAVGTVYFDISLSKSGSPFYAARTRLGVPASIRSVHTSLLTQAPPAGSTAVGAPIEITISLMDFDHDVVLTGATIMTNWTDIAGTSYSIVEIGDGEYRLSLNTTGLLAQKYTFEIWNVKPFYQSAVATVSVQPGAATLEIVLDKTAYYADWGEVVNITFQLVEPYYDTPIPGANASLLWNGTLYYFVDLDNGYYGLLLDTSDSDFGMYSPQITATRTFYQPRTKSFTLIVDKAVGQILPEQTVYDVVIQTSIGFTVYLNDTVSNEPVVGAVVTMEWNGTVYPLTPTGVPGYYNGTVDVTDFAIGQYAMLLRAVSLNHEFLETIVDINVVPIPTSLALSDGANLITVFFGDYVHILVVYNDTFHKTIITGANVTYTLGSLSGTLIQEANGTYSGTVDVSGLPSQSIYLRLTAHKAGYATGLDSVVVTILPIPTETSVDTPTQSGYFGDNLTYLFTYYDTQHAQYISGATVHAAWEGGTATVTDLLNGSYLVQLDLTLTTPGLYDLIVTFSLSNYTSRTLTAYVELYATPAQILGPTSLSFPINDTISVEYIVVNQLDNSSITDVIGVAYSPQLGEQELILSDGVYTLFLGDGLPFGTYTFDIAFTTAKYVMSPIHLEVQVREIRTALLLPNTTIITQPNVAESIQITYFDLDHQTGISGANITIEYSQSNITFLEDLTLDEDGVYTLFFQALVGRTFQVTITFEKDDYVTAFVVLTIKSDISAEQQFQQTLTLGGGSALILIAFLLVAYVRVWSVPKQLRELTRMIRALAKGRVPKPADAPTRQSLAMDIVNEEISPLKLSKDETEVAPEPIITTVPEVNELLEELAAITGLGEEEIEAFRADLARMKPSERPGFLKEVINQEKARRADALARPSERRAAVEDMTLDQLPDELEDLKQRLLKKGMAPEEIEVIIEESKSLSKADLEALLDSLGIDLE